MTYTIIQIVIIVGLVFYLIKKDNPQNKNGKAVEEIYEDMRNLALNVTAKQLGIDEIKDDKVYGLVTEMDMKNGSTTIAAFLTGDASIYLSSGSGFIGSGTHQNVKRQIKVIIENIDKFKQDAIKINNVKLPEEGEVIFNFLTKNGIYQIKEEKEEVMSEKSKYANLYKEVDKIITIIRIDNGQ